MNPLRKLVAGDAQRKTRLHDHKGNLVGAAALANLPRAAASWLALKVARRRPPLPWISYNAITRVEGILGPGARVLEFGSGTSTVWFAERCGSVHSIEHDRNWHCQVAAQLVARGLANVRYDLRGFDDYCDLADYAAPAVDFCLVDGIRRLQCVAAALPVIVPGGWIYLDNSDVIEPERQAAERLIQEAAARGGGTVEYFTDFAPAQLHANQGLLARV